MKPVIMFLFLALVVGPASLRAEHPATNSDHPTEDPSSGEGSAVNPSISSRPTTVRPFSLGATTFGVSPLGAQLQFTTNVNRYMNLRSNLNVLSFGTDLSSEGFEIHTLVHMASSGTSIDLYPFPNHGLHFSPGVLVHNPFVAGGDIALGSQSGSSFKLNGQTYYSSATQPVWADARVNLPRVGFTMTTGWSNVVSRDFGRFSFPVEVGVAFLGSPAVKVPLSSGQICDAQGQNCTDVTKAPGFQSDLQAQAVKYQSNMSVLRTYPIVSVGVAYHYHLPGRSR